MHQLLPIGRVFFALAFLGLGLEHFLFGIFVIGRAPEWPTGLPGQSLWVYVSGAIIIWTGIAILARRRARVAALLAAVIILLWAVLRHLPVVAADSFLAPSWTALGKALTLFGGSLAMAGTSPGWNPGRTTPSVRFLNRRGEFILLARICLGIFLMITGIQHFMYTEFVASLIPGWFPGNATWWTWFAGVALIAGGMGLLIGFLAPLAALLSGLMVFSWFWIVHLPRSLGGVSDRISVFEALAVSGIALVIAGFLFQAKRVERAAPVGP
ncbi:MAG: DoxX family membrane protein [Gemmatimonadales bacterium]